MTTAFQYVFDYASELSFDRRSITAQTVSRNNTVRTVSRGGQAWRFEVTLPDGPRWSDIRSVIESIDAADRYTVGTVQLNNPGYLSWLSGYQGNSVNSTGFLATWNQGATAITLTTSPTTTSGFKFRAGDLIQLGTSATPGVSLVYSVTSDVAFNSNTVPVHRPILDATVTAPTALRVGGDCRFKLICTTLPRWRIFARDQVSWDGAFVFYEVLPDDQ
jgi:hypothetical protein